MKKAASLLCSLGLMLTTSVVSVSAQSSFGKSLNDYGLTGHVKGFTQVAYEPVQANGLVLAGKERLLSNDNYWLLFAAQGWTLQASDANMVGGTTARTSYVMGCDGLRCKSTTTAYNMKDVPLDKWETSYNHRGQPLKEQRFNDILPTTKRIYTYDEQGRVVKITDDNLVGLAAIYYTISYNDNGQPETIVQYKKRQGTVQYRFSYAYNPKGLLMDVTANDATGLRIGTAHFVYNHRGDVAIAKLEGETKKAIELVNCASNTKSLPASLKEGAYTFDYSYDPRGNWEQCTTAFNGTPQQVLVRQIEYFF